MPPKKAAPKKSKASPPEQYKWLPGQSGNPRGRPRLTKTFQEQFTARLTPQARNKIIDRLISKAQGGDQDATKLVLSYGLGPPPRESLVQIGIVAGQANVSAQQSDMDALRRLSTYELQMLQYIQERAAGLNPEPPPQPPPIRPPALQIAPHEPEPEPKPEPEVIEAEVIEAEVVTFSESAAPDPDLLENQQNQRGGDDLWRPSPWGR